MEYLLSTHAAGDCNTPTELEQIMYEEAKYLIQQYYDNKDGAFDLYNLLQKKNKGKNLLEVT